MNSIDLNRDKINLNGATLDISYVEPQTPADENVYEGVTCKVYSILDDEGIDLGVIEIESACHTPAQLVLEGSYTLEGTVEGYGYLIIKKENGGTEVFAFENSIQTAFTAIVEVGDIMQWHAHPSYPLTVFEVCSPPYADGRFEDLTDVVLAVPSEA